MFLRALTLSTLFFSSTFAHSLAFAQFVTDPVQVEDDGGFDAPVYLEGDTQGESDFIDYLNQIDLSPNLFDFFAKKVCAVKTEPCNLWPTKNNIQINVHLNNNRQGQHLIVTADGEQLWKAEISTGVSGHRTPVGYFDLLKSNGGRLHKTRNHCSSVADWGRRKDGVVYLAPMPYAVHFNGGIAFHMGKVTGKPESHGCVRQHTQDARNLYCLLLSGDNWMRTNVTVSAY